MSYYWCKGYDLNDRGKWATRRRRKHQARMRKSCVPTDGKGGLYFPPYVARSMVRAYRKKRILKSMKEIVGAINNGKPWLAEMRKSKPFKMKFDPSV